MKKVKRIAGILLILCAAGGLVFWEARGRELVTTEQVLVAKTEIERGTPVREELFRVVGIPEKNRIEGGLAPEEFSKIKGRAAAQTIVQNAQISSSYFQEDRYSLKPGESIFVIPKEWICMRSSALRGGDRIVVYTDDGSREIGRYQVAFVKDDADREVKDAGEFSVGEVLKREDSTSQITHLEIISDLNGYQELRQAAQLGGLEGEDQQPSLLILHEPPEQKGENEK